VTEFQSPLSQSHESMGWVLKQTGKPAEALAAFERAIAIMQKLADANPSVTQWQSELAFNLSMVGGLHLKAGRTAEAVASLRRAVANWMRLSSRTPRDLYNLSCSHAKLADLAAEPGSGMTAAEGQAESDRAMEWLRQAVAAGYRKLSIMRTDTDLDPLRSRPDFRLLIMDLEFPADPFGS
jgi:tetratricopeptide (TPR) repeat protein